MQASEKFWCAASLTVKMLAANSLHKNFYENELTREVVEKMAEDVKQLITKLQEVE